MILLSLLFSLHAFAWEKIFPDVPRSAVALAAFNEIAIGFELEGGKGSVEYFDYRGQRTVRKTAKLDEWPLAMRAYGDDLYVLTKGHLWIVDLIEGGVTKRAILPVRCFDLIVDRTRSAYCSGSDGLYFLEQGHTQWARLSREPMDGIFLLGDSIFLLRGEELKRWDGKLELKQPRKRPGAFRYLARSSGGDWLTIDGKSVRRRVNKKWVVFDKYQEAPGHVSYLYQMDTKQDHVLVVFPASRRLLAQPFLAPVSNAPKQGVSN